MTIVSQECILNNKIDQKFSFFGSFSEKPYSIMQNTLSTYLFWDIDQDTLDLHRHKRFIIERMLQYGRPEDIHWLLDHYSKNDIVDVIKRSKTIDRKTASYWSIHYHIPEKEILCLNRPLIQDCFY